ncbi:MAG: polyphosphate kinase 1 [Akkermansiaceae bacterium]
MSVEAAMETPFINRELSWLEFNQRVLNEALRQDLPLLDRLKFLAITDSNLDEFFQVRLGGLHTIHHNAPEFQDQHGESIAEQITAIEMRTRRFAKHQAKLIRKDLLPRLKEVGLGRMKIKDLSEDKYKWAESYFANSVCPLLTPMALEGINSRELVPSLCICVALRILSADESQSRVVIIPLPPSTPRIIRLENEGFILLEDLIGHFCSSIFPEESPTEITNFRLTRNTDIPANEDCLEDFATEIRQVVNDRSQSFPVRLQLSKDNQLSKEIIDLLQVDIPRVHLTKGPLALTDFFELSLADDFSHLRSSSLPSSSSPKLDETRPVIETLRDRDVILAHPYQHYGPVLRFIREAADDPRVLAIKQVLYRTAKDSQIVDSLIRAAKSGKQVTALVELKARFDEVHNLDRAEELRRAGAQVIYGVKGLKTHAKLALVIRQEGDSLRHYVHIGTGNYNEVTSKFYTDISILTSRPAVGNDAALFFNAVTGQTRFAGFETLVPAPTQMRDKILELIRFEIEQATIGNKARIRAKINSLEDREIITALYRAADAGVEILLNVRGICCLVPRKNIQVVSIVDQYLEHMRILAFHHEGAKKVFITSADWMNRNLSKRVELMLPVRDEHCRKTLVKILKASFRDNQNASLILPDGTSKRIIPAEGEAPFRMQAYLSEFFSRKAEGAEQQRTLQLEPHLPKE